MPPPGIILISSINALIPYRLTQDSRLVHCLRARMCQVLRSYISLEFNISKKWHIGIRRRYQAVPHSLFRDSLLSSFLFGWHKSAGHSSCSFGTGQMERYQEHPLTAYSILVRGCARARIAKRSSRVAARRSFDHCHSFQDIIITIKAPSAPPSVLLIGEHRRQQTLFRTSA